MNEAHVNAADLLALRTGGLRPDRIGDVLDHVAVCPECRAAASKGIPLDHAGEALLASVLREDDPAEAAETFADIAAAPALTRDIFLRPATAIAASLIVVVGAALWIRSRPVHPPPGRAATAARSVAVSPSSPARWRSEVDAIAARGAIDPPAEWVSLQIGEVTFRGDAVAAPAAVMSPYRDIVGETRPRFRWAAPAGATSVVSIYDGSALVTSSGVLTSREWTADRELESGHSYLWQLEIRQKDGRTLLPPPSEPVARFVIADAQTRARLDAARRADPNDHLTPGILAALAGMQDEAERELELVTPASPRYRAARALLSSVRGWSQRAGNVREK